MAQLQVLIAGESASGKSWSLETLSKDNPKAVAYINCEAGKSTPFANNFTTLKTGVKHPIDVVNFFKKVESMPNIEYCVVDGFNFMMDMYEDMVVNTSNNTQAGWGSYGAFVREFMQSVVGPSTKKWIIIAHNFKEFNTVSGNYRFYVPIKGASAKTGLESYFNIVVYTRTVTADEIAKIEQEIGEPLDTSLLHFSAKEKRLGVKYIYQLQTTQQFVEGRIRELKGLWADNQIIMDNDAQALVDHINNYLNNNTGNQNND